MKTFILGLCLTLTFSTLFAQNDNYFQGFSRKINGTEFTYQSPIPQVKSSMIIRGQQSFSPLEWESENVKFTKNDDFVNLMWIFSLDVTSNPASFQLHVNGEPWINFENPVNQSKDIIEFEGKMGSRLNFRATLWDNHGDMMGFATLKLPSKALKRNKPVLLKITSSSHGNNAWYMTFQSPIAKKTAIYQNNVVIKSKNGPKHSANIDIIHTGAPVTAKIKVGELEFDMPLNTGYNTTEFSLKKVTEKTEFTARISKPGSQDETVGFTLSPVREWEIYLVQHTHTDIGYTRPQTEILAEHLKYIDQALDYCDETDQYPDAAKFRWTAETSWSVREYLRSRPQSQVDRLLKRMEEGRIEATGMFLNYSEIIDEPALAHQTKTLKLLKERGITVETAMQNDVNGIGWSMIDNLKNTSVKYLTMGVHAHRARKPFNQPTTFWWESPAGNRLMAYRSEHYMAGNMLGITGHQQEVFRNNLSTYLTGLEGKNYPYNIVSLQFSGYVTDNSPPSTVACDIIKEWNEKYEWPKLRSALASDFMRFMEKEHKDELSTKQVAWPDWWTDGVASAANETKVVRKAQINMARNNALLSMGKFLGTDTPELIERDIEEIYDDILFYDEHTHGASESIREPLAQNTINQWGIKSAYAWDAINKSYLLEEKALGFLQETIPVNKEHTITVYNTLNWERSGMVEIFIPYKIAGEGEKINIVDKDGHSMPYHLKSHREEGSYFEIWLTDVPAFGYKTFSILKTAPDFKTPKFNNAFENEFYKIEIDTTKGIITSLFDKELDKELLDKTENITLGQFIYEELESRHELERLTASNRDTVYRPLNIERTTLSDIKLVNTDWNPIYSSIFINGQMPVCTDEKGVDLEIRLYHVQKKIELHYKMKKLPVFTPEAVYVSFPFKLDQGKLAFEAQGGVVNPGKNQLEGSSSDWNTLQNFASVKNQKEQIVFVSDEIPLVQFGAINTGRFYYRLNPKTNHIYSWVMNNYWVTNFKASQLGELRWHYDITSGSDTSDSFAARFGREERIPFAARLQYAGTNSDSALPASKSLLNLQQDNILLVNVTLSADKKGVILYLRETEGKSTTISVKNMVELNQMTEATEVNILEDPIEKQIETIKFSPYETKYIHLSNK